MQVVENQPIMWSVLTSGCFGRTIENRRCFLAEVRVARPKAMYLDADETGSVQFSQCLFHERRQDKIDETIQGIRESVYELYMLLC